MLSFLQSSFPELYRDEERQRESEEAERRAVEEKQAAIEEALKQSLPPPLPPTAPPRQQQAYQQLVQQQQQQLQQQQAEAEAAERERMEREEAEREPDQYEQKIERIKSKFESKQISADELEQYLKSAAEEAKAAEARALSRADQEYTPAWQKTGLPMKPSHLQLDPETMQQGGLVNPKAIMQQFHQVRAKEVHNPPRTYEYNDARIQPNYLKPTANMKSRKSTVLPPEKAERVRTMYLTERTWPHLSEEEVAQHIQESEERRRVQDLRMPAAQYELEKKLIASMNHKLAFLRNPRYPEPPSLKMLKSQFEPGGTWGTAGKDGAPKTRPKPPIKSDMTCRPEQVFVVEPEKVLFTDYQAGQVYRHIVKIRNVTSVIRNLRLLPPASQYFHTSMLSYPTESGCVAPGMCAEVTVRFTPDSLADYNDVMVVDTDAHRFPVELQARRQPPMLTLEQELHVGEVVCGNRRVQQFHFTNEGGHSRFRIVPESYWPLDYADAPQDLAQAGPFQVWPLYFDLPTGAEVGLNIAYEPVTVGEHSERLVMVCDNCQVKDFRIVGIASDIDIHLESIDSIPVSQLPQVQSQAEGESSSPRHVPRLSDASLTSLASDLTQASISRSRAKAGNSALDTPLWFGEVVPGSGFSRRMSVRNTTLLPFPFKWSFSSLPETRSSHVPSLSFRYGPESSPQPCVGTEALSLAHLRDHSHDGTGRAGGKGQLDLVRLGLEEEMGFLVQPQEGVLQPGELAEFYFTFRPLERKRYLYWAQLKVDKNAIGQSPEGCNVCVLEAGLEGLAAPLLLEMAPRVYKIPGTLTPGCTHTRPITLHNPSRAPAHFSFHHPDHSPGNLLTVEPSSGVVPPSSSVSLLLTFSAPARQCSPLDSIQGGSPQLDDPSPGGQRQLQPGAQQLSISSSRRALSVASGAGTAPHTWAFEEEVVCHVQHGGVMPLVVAALVAEPRVELVTTRLDFGLLRLGSFKNRTLQLKNASATCGASWVLEEMVSKDGGPPRQVVDTEHEHSTHLGFNPSRGWLGPGEHADVQVTCYGGADGQHHSIVKLTSPSSGALECLEAFAVVVTPRLVVSTPQVDMGVTFLGVQAKFSVKLRNLALLPVEYEWAVEGRKVPKQQVGKGAAAAIVANMLLGGPQSQAALESLVSQGCPELMDLDGDDAEGEIMPAEVKIRPESGILDPGEEIEVKVRFTPKVVGPITMYGVCNLVGSPVPSGFAVSSTTRGLDVVYELLSEEQQAAWSAARAKPKALKRKDDVDHFVGMTHLPKELLTRLGGSRMAKRSHPQPPRHTNHVANFGNTVPLGEARHMYLVVTNYTAISTFVHTCLDEFGVNDLNRLTGKDTQSSGKGTSGLPSSLQQSPQTTQVLGQQGGSIPQLHPNPTHGVRELRQLASMASSKAPGKQLNAAQPPRFSAAGGGGWVGTGGQRLSQAGSGRFSIGEFAATQPGPRHAPIKLNGQTERLAPFRSPVGNAMMATRRMQEESSDVLGKKGLAISVSPPTCLLGPWSSTIMQLSCFNDMCGDYQDTLHVQVGSLPKKEIPVRVGVSGTPLVVQQERALIAGLKGRQWRLHLPMGTLPVGVPMTKTFYVFNTGGLDMHLDWTFLRYQDDSDCARPEAKIFNVHLEPTTIHPPPITDEDRAAAQAAMEAVAAEEAARKAAAEAAEAEAKAMEEAMAAAARKRGGKGGPGAKTGTETPKGGARAGGSARSKAGQGKETPKGGAAGKGGKGGAPGQRPPSSMSNTERDSAADEESIKAEEEAKEREKRMHAQAEAEAVRKRHPLPRSFLLAQEGPYEGVRISLSPNAAPDTAPYVVEPRSAIIKGGSPAKFTLRFTSDRAAHHSGYLHGVQKVFSPEVPLSLRTWPTGEQGEGVGVMISGTFHPYAGQPPAPLQPLRVDLSATSMRSYLEPDANSELEFSCCSTQPPTHPAYKHVITLTNLQACPLMFSLATEGPFQLLSAAPSVPQDPVIFKGTTGLMQQPAAPGMVPPPPTWAPDQIYLPPQGSVDATIQFQPQKVGHRDDFELSGHLAVNYANGDTQQLPLRGRIQHPALQLVHAQQLLPDVARQPLPDPTARNWSAPLVFGKVHVQSPKPLEVVLSNPTLVYALWAVAGNGEKPRYLPQPPSEKGKLVGLPKPADRDQTPHASTSGIPPPFRGISAAGQTATLSATNTSAEDSYAVGRAVPQWAANEAKFGAFTVWPAAGCLPGRGLHLPRTQSITITFSPPDNKEHRQLIVFGCSKGRPVALELVGCGSYDEVEEFQGRLYQI